MHQKLKILFAIRSADHFIYYRSIAEALLGRGHGVRLLYDARWTEKKDSLEKLSDFQKTHPGFEFAEAVRRNDFWRKILFHTREFLSYRSYLLPPRSELRKYYHDRWYGYLPQKARSALKHASVKIFVKSGIFAGILKGFEKIAPSCRQIINDIKKYQPDAVLASPVNLRFSSSDLEYLKAAKALKIPTAVSVISWDNLTNKGLIHIIPDILFVWSEEGRKEAISHHHIPERNIRITGAPLFDQWFSPIRPSQTREEFCWKYGLRAKDPIILYLGSSVNVARDESWVLEKLRTALDKDEALKHTQMVIRPHPANFKIYEKLNLKDITVLPKTGSLPNSKDAFQLFYDMLTFSVGTISINTSGMIDAIIAGKPGMAFMPDEYKDSQMDTMHFRHLFLSGAVGGVKNGEEFALALKKLLKGEDAGKGKREAFIKNYIRPRGIGVSAGEAIAGELEKLILRS